MAPCAPIITLLLVLCLHTSVQGARIDINVYNDINGNGVRGSDEPPLEGIEFCIDGNLNANCDSNELMAESDGDGRAVFDNLEGGQSYPVIVDGGSTDCSTSKKSIGDEDTFEITYVFSRELAKQREIVQVFERARQIIESFITRDIPNIFIDGIEVDDLNVHAKIMSADNKNKRQAIRSGPTHVRPGSYLPAISIIEIDRVYMEKALKDGKLQATIERQLLYCLGLNHNVKNTTIGIKASILRELYKLGYQVDRSRFENSISPQDLQNDEMFKTASVGAPVIIPQKVSGFTIENEENQIGKRILAPFPVSNNFETMPVGRAFNNDFANVVEGDAAQGSRYLALGNHRSIEKFTIVLAPSIDTNTRRILASFYFRFSRDFAATSSFFRLRIGAATELTFTLATDTQVNVFVQSGVSVGIPFQLTDFQEWQQFTVDRNDLLGRTTVYVNGNSLSSFAQVLGDIDSIELEFQVPVGLAHLDNIKFDTLQAPRGGQNPILFADGSIATVNFPLDCGGEVPTRSPTRAPTTRAPTTRAPTTRAPTTRSPTTRPPTRAPTTRAPTTRAPTTRPPTTRPPTRAPTTRPPTTRAPTTRSPTTRAPALAPTTLPPTRAPTTRPPTTLPPNTNPPTTRPPVTSPPTATPTAGRVNINYLEIRQTLTNEWQVFNLASVFNSMVVVCTPSYTSGEPRVVRVDVVSSFRIRLRVQLAGEGIAPPTSVFCVIVDEGVYSFTTHGIQMEARRVESTTTAFEGAWSQNREQLETRDYFNPIVLGQVMTANDAKWSSFWASGSFAISPPDRFEINVGKHVGEDLDRRRATETLGVIIVDAGSGRFTTLNGRTIAYEAENTDVRMVSSMVSSVPRPIPVFVPVTSADTLVIASAAGIFDSDGGWPIVYTSGDIRQTSVQINLAFDEDISRDNEREHSNENASYFVTA